MPGGKVKLRKYQKESAKAAVDYNENNIIVLSTGAGKSFVISEIIRLTKAKKTLIFQPTSTILKQNLEHYNSLIGKNAAIMSASAGGHETGKVTFATIGTAANRPEEFKGTDLIIIDEAHNVPIDRKKSQFMKFFKNIGYEGKVIGLTATPSRNYRKFDKKTMQMRKSIDVLTEVGKPNSFWKSFSYIVDIKYLIENGYLMKPDYQLIEDIDTSKLKLTASGDSFTKDSIKEFDWENYLIVYNTCKIAYQERNSIICFVDTIEVAKKIAEMLQEDGYNADYMSSERSRKENDEVLEKFRKDKKSILCNVAMATEGIDVKKCDAVILGTPTASLNRYIQRAGRCVRPLDGKKTPIIYDIAQSSLKFAKIEDIIWTEKEIKVRNSDKILSGFQDDFEFEDKEFIRKEAGKQRQSRLYDNDYNQNNSFIRQLVSGTIESISENMTSKKGNTYKKIEISTEDKIITLLVMEKNFRHFSRVKEGDEVNIQASIKNDFFKEFGFGYFVKEEKRYYRKRFF